MVIRRYCVISLKTNVEGSQMKVLQQDNRYHDQMPGPHGVGDHVLTNSLILGTRITDFVFPMSIHAERLSCII